MFDIVDAGFRRAEHAAGAAVLWRHPVPGGAEAGVTAGRLYIGPVGRPADGDAYDFPTPMAAVLGAARWIESGCRGEPGGWNRHAATGRARSATARRGREVAWVCPRHRDRLPAFDHGHLFCPACARQISDAVQVAWPPPDAYAR